MKLLKADKTVLVGGLIFLALGVGAKLWWADREAMIERIDRARNAMYTAEAKSDRCGGDVKNLQERVYAIERHLNFP